MVRSLQARRVTVRDRGSAYDVELSIDDPTVTIGDVFTAVAGRPAGSSVLVDGTRHDRSVAVGRVAVANGSVISDGSIDSDGQRAPVESEQVLTTVAGLDAGVTEPLRPGRFDVGTGDERVDGTGFRLDISAQFAPRVERAGRTPVAVDGEPLAVGEVAAGQTITVPGAVFRVGPGRPPRRPTAASQASIPYRRTPRDRSECAAEPPMKPSAPRAGRDAESFSWLVALAPIPIGIVVALLLSPYFLVFMLLSPVLAGARWVDGRGRARREAARRDREIADSVATYRSDLIVWRMSESSRRRRLAPDLGVMIDRVRSAQPGLWERRPDHDDFLRATVAIGDIPFPTEPGDLREADEVAEAEARLASVPIDVDLAPGGAVGVVGDPLLRSSVASAIVAELALHHGPADVQLALFLADDRRQAWEWTKWLPHLTDERGRRQVITDPSAAHEFAHRVEGHGGVRSTVTIVDGTDVVNGVAALSALVRRGIGSMIVVADSFDDLPAVCRTVVDVRPTDRAACEIVDLSADGRRLIGTPIVLDAGVATDIARSLAALSDPEWSRGTTGLPPDCDFRHLVAGSLDAAEIERVWGERGEHAGLRWVVGSGADGPIEIDLVSDGPHALIAGTTGSGKSELLRTMVASLARFHDPTEVNIVLVDFKGGGAFDACADLPHTVGVVTDLDEHLAARALRCLRAEVRHRERRLRDLGVSDIADLTATHATHASAATADPLPRLVVVIDEFATLAAELPEFLSSLVDVAQRGRSLGIHLVLATQRPAGVVDGKIRANTNIRVALRVQDDGDALDVIGDRRPAAIDRTRPGRAYLRIAGGDPVPVQTATVSRRSTESSLGTLSVRPFDLVESGRARDPRRPPTSSESDLALLVRATGEVAHRRALAAPRVPWPHPLPQQLDIGTIDPWDAPEPTARAAGPIAAAAAPCSTERWSVPLGLVDRPDEQRIDVWRWTPELGNVLCYGFETASTTLIVHTMIRGLARRLPPDRMHAYVLDGAGTGGLVELAALPHVGAVVGGGDEERRERVVSVVERELDDRAESLRETGRSHLGAGADRPLLLLAIANHGALEALANEGRAADFGTRLERIVRDGPDLGVFVVMTASHERAVSGRIAGAMRTRLVMRMADAGAYSTLGLRTRDVPELGPGRAVEVEGGAEVQLARTSSAMPVRTETVDANSSRSLPAPIAILGDDIDGTGVVERSTLLRRGWRLSIGVRHRDLQPATIDLAPDTHLVVSGGPGSGKTTALRSIVVGARIADPDHRLVVFGDREEWPDAVDRLPDDLADDIDRRVLVVVDGLTSIDDEIAAALERIASRTVWFAVADRAERMAIPTPWLRRTLASRTGVLLQPRADHGDLLRCRLGPWVPQRCPVGRGVLVDAGAGELVQLCNTVRPAEPTMR